MLFYFGCCDTLWVLFVECFYFISLFSIHRLRVRINVSLVAINEIRFSTAIIKKHFRTHSVPFDSLVLIV